MNSILVTGGTGYIGSHTVVAFQQAGFDVIVLDDLSNSSERVLDRIETITGIRPRFYLGSIADQALLNSIFESHPIDAVIHFAGFKAVGESVQYPLRYYQNNVAGSMVLFDAMQKAGCKKLVFSSSATVYGDPGVVAYTEQLPLKPVNPYGQSKRMVEDIARDLQASDRGWSIALLRYFNPVGAHPSGLIGEDPRGVPNNLMPYIAKVAVGELPEVNVFGDDYPTPDGTGVRDYIHVQDLARGHLDACRYLNEHKGCKAFNLGTGCGYSVMEAVDAFRKVSGQPIPVSISPRRAGDLPEYFAVPDFTEKELGWKAELNLDDMVQDHWNWQKSNPKGYEK
ncbi:MAG: UDP-glucose 4-epimerase GalE [Pseudomonadales bacterium]